MVPNEHAQPTCGSSAKTLGVRIPDDITPDEAGQVHPRSGGMSCSPSLMDLPPHRRPKRLGKGARGSDELCVFRIVAVQLPVDLAARPDPAAPRRHVFVEPARVMPANDLSHHLCATRPLWVKVA